MKMLRIVLGMLIATAGIAGAGKVLTVVLADPKISWQVLALLLGACGLAFVVGTFLAFPKLWAALAEVMGNGIRQFVTARKGEPAPPPIPERDLSLTISQTDGFAAVPPPKPPEPPRTA